MDKIIVKIKCFLCDSLNSNSYKIKIYDIKDNRILNSFTNNKGQLTFSLEKEGIYRIQVFNNKVYPKKRQLVFYIDNNNNTNILIAFNYSKITPRPITIKLTDQYYKDLPIFKGRMTLWTSQKK